MSQQYGLTAAGFIPKPQSVILSEIQDSLRQALGININLLPEAVLGQVAGIASEREALLWQLAEAVYSSQYPSGAEGTSVDNILALNNLRRLPATASKTAPTADNGTPGLVLYGTPGTPIPAGSIIQILGNTVAQFTLDATVTIAAAVNAVQSVVFSNTPNTGSFALQIVDTAGNTLTTALISYLALAANSQYSFGSTPATGNYTLTLTKAGAALTTASLAYDASAATVQSAIQALTGYSGATVTGSMAAGFVINWGANACPLVTVGSNTTGVTMTTVDSVQAAINNLHDTTAANYPLTDVQVSGTYGTSFTVSFGAGTPVGVNPGSGSLAQAVFAAITNTLKQTTTATNISLSTSVAGSPAQAIGSATATTTGPIYAPAGSLTVIGSPVAGWSGVSNPLDVVVGTNIETDTAALARRLTLLAAQANGPIQSIIEKVQLVTGVTAAIGFENTSGTTDGSGRPAKSFEIVVLGGTDLDVATAIYKAKPAGIQSYGSTSYTLVDDFGNNYVINFSRPTQVPIYVSIVLQTDLSSPNPKFQPGNIATIQQDIVTIGNATPIGGTIIGFGSNGLIGAFNNIPGIKTYTLNFGTSPSPTGNANIALAAEQIALFETFNVTVSYT